MTILTFLQYFKSAVECAVNSKIVFAFIAVLAFIIFLRTVGGFICRFVRDHFIFNRGGRYE